MNNRNNFMNVQTKTRQGRVTKDRRVGIKSARGITAMAMLSAISVILMLFEIPLWFAPSFYEIDFSEVPVLIGAFALGPLAGVVIELLKILLNLAINGTMTMFVGEFANFLIGIAFVVPAAIIYQRKKTKKSAMIGLVIGTVFMVLVGAVLNAYVLIPAFAKAFQMPIKTIVEMGTMVNPGIQSLWDLILLAVVPFNLLKGVLVSFVTGLIYKGVSSLIKGFH